MQESQKSSRVKSQSKISIDRYLKAKENKKFIEKMTRGFTSVVVVLLVLLIMPMSVFAEAFIKLKPANDDVYEAIATDDKTSPFIFLRNQTNVIYIPGAANETDPFYTDAYSGLAANISSKLNITDQRYNDTLLIQAVNTTANIEGLGFNTTSTLGTLFYPLSSNPSGYLTAESDPSFSAWNYNYSSLIGSPVNLSEFVNDAGYLTNATLIDNWVNESGDSMSGHLNMSNYSIWDVDILQVHNITGKSPVYVDSPIISTETVNATNFYGNFFGDITGANGTIFGMNIENGTITNMHVSDSAIFNTSLLPELNYTWSLGNDTHIWKNFYVGDLIATNITSPSIVVYYSDESWINKLNTTFYFNSSYLDDYLTLNYTVNLSSVIELIEGVNTTSNIQGLGFNTTSQLSLLYYSIDNPSNYINDTSTFYNSTFIDSVFVNNSFLNNNFYNNTFMNNNFWNNSFIDNNFWNNSFMANNFYNNSFIDANYYNVTQVDELIQAVNQTYNDTGVLAAIATLNDTKLNVTDQRYNDTTYIDTQLNNYVLTTDFSTNNASVWAELNIKGTSNLTLAEVVAGVGNWSLDKMNYNTTVELNTLYYPLDSNPSGYLTQESDPVFLAWNFSWTNLTNIPADIADGDNDTTYTNLSEFVNDVGYITDYTETDPIFTANNASIYSAINVKLNESDQRYNETSLIVSVNSTIKQPAGPYLYNTSTHFYVNETYLNTTINNISEVRQQEETFQITASSGQGDYTTSSLDFMITKITVTPTTITNNYRFSLIESDGTVIDRDRIPHTGEWNIEKSYALQNSVIANITNANIDEVFNITITYIQNGVII